MRVRSDACSNLGLEFVSWTLGDGNFHTLRNDVSQ